MPRQPNYAKRVTNLATVTTTTSTTVTLPTADVFTFILSSGTGSGTSPTLDAVIQNTPDGGTTWVNTALKFTQATTGAAAIQITVAQNRAMLTGSNAVAATGSLLSKDTVLSPKIRILYTIAGTNPSYATITMDLFALTAAN